MELPLQQLTLHLLPPFFHILKEKQKDLCKWRTNLSMIFNVVKTIPFSDPFLIPKLQKKVEEGW